MTKVSAMMKEFIFKFNFVGGNRYILIVRCNDMEKERVIYTIGHSTHPLEEFTDLLRQHKIDTLIDVRTTPASNYNPQFKKEVLQSALSRLNIKYLHFGDEFGARQNDRSVLDDEGVVNFELVQKTYNFQMGMERVDIGVSRGYRIALMCAEADPLECHRFSMISRPISQIGINVIHILKNGDTVSHDELEAEMLKNYEKKLPVPSLFEPEISAEDRLKFAYRLHNKDVGWRSGNQENIVRYD